MSTFRKAAFVVAVAALVYKPVVVVGAIATIGAICFVLFPLVAIAHENAHAAVLRRFGYQPEISYRGPSIRGRTWPTGGGHVDVVPSVRYEEISRAEQIAVSLAPFAIGLATSPIPIYIGLGSGRLALILGLWLVLLGPSLSDYLLALEALRGRYPFRLEPATGPESTHVLAEGIEVAA